MQAAHEKNAQKQGLKIQVSKGETTGLSMQNCDDGMSPLMQRFQGQKKK
jgi:hypothetical protein